MRLFTTTLVSILLFVTYSCYKTANDPSSEDDFYLNGTDKEKFESLGVCYTAAQAELLPESTGLGSTPTNAVVQLLFKADGNLYTAEELNEILPSLFSGEQDITPYFTDLKSFYKVTKQVTAQPEYALPLGSKYVYDAYRLQYHTYKDLQKIAEEKYLKVEKTEDRNYTGFLKYVDILKGSWTNGNQYGHACIVTTAPSGTYNTINALLSATTTFDAWGDMPNPNDDIAYKNGATYWASSNCNYRARLRPDVELSATQKNTIKNYAVAQNPDQYSLYTTLWSESLWYCSKLVFRSYYQGGLDIKNGAVSFVTPSDIEADPDLWGVCF